MLQRYWQATMLANGQKNLFNGAYLFQSRLSQLPRATFAAPNVPVDCEHLRAQREC